MKIAVFLTGRTHKDGCNYEGR